MDYILQNVDCWQRIREYNYIKQSLNILYPMNIWFTEHKRPHRLTVKVCKIKRQQPSYLGYPL